MDAQDLAILAAFAREPRATYGDVGTRVGLSGNAVKARVRRMTDEGVLRGFPAIPDASVLGLAEGLLVFTGVEDLDEREEEILRSLPDAAGVVFVDVAMDHAVYVWTLHDGAADLDRIERAAISLIGKPPTHRVLGEPTPAPVQSPDWRVARALLPDARASLKDLATASGLSLKTLKRRLGAILRSGAVRIEPVLSGTEASGALLFRVIAVLADEHAPAPDALPADAIVTRAASGRVLVMDLQRATPHDAQAELRRVKSIAGVERAFLQVATRRRFAAWLDEALAARVAAATPALARPAETVAEERAPVAPIQRAGRL